MTLKVSHGHPLQEIKFTSTIFASKLSHTQ